MESTPSLHTPEEELVYLREQVSSKEKEIAIRSGSERAGGDDERVKIISETIHEHRAAPAEVLAPAYRINETAAGETAEKILADLNLGGDEQAIKGLQQTMEEKGIKSFDVAVLNMVLHSVDDATCTNILNGVRNCLKPTGAIILIVPTGYWFVQKLIEYAQDKGMDRKRGTEWVAAELNKPEVKVPMRIRGGEYYPHPLTVFPRGEDDYGRLLDKSGYGYLWNGYDAETHQLTDSTKLTHMNMEDYTSSQILRERDRSILVSFYFPEKYWRAWKKQYNYRV